MMSTRRYLLYTLLLLAACTGTASQSTPHSATPDFVSVPQDAPSYGLLPGDYRLTLIGAVTGEQMPFSAGAAPPVEYSPVINGMRQPGSNNAGHVGLRLRAKLADGRNAALLLEFDGELGADTHTVGTNSDLNPAAVGAVLQVQGRAPFSRSVSGTLTLDFINRRTINGFFDITLRDNDGQAVTAQGAFHRIPFTPREEFSMRFGDGFTIVESGSQFSKGLQGTSRFITLHFTTRQAFQEPVTGSLTITAADFAALQPGEYAVADDESPVQVRALLDSVEIPVLDGTVLFVRTHDTINGVEQSVWQGAFTLSLLTNAGNVTMTGLFNHFDLY